MHEATDVNAIALYGPTDTPFPFFQQLPPEVFCQFSVNCSFVWAAKQLNSGLDFSVFTVF